MTKSLVVVDDDVDMRALIRVVLGGEPELRIAAETDTADSAIALVEREQPDLIILNHFLEGDTRGLAVAGALKRAAPGSKVVLFSSTDLTIEAGRDSAVDAFVSKRRLLALLPTVSELLDLAG